MGMLFFCMDNPDFRNKIRRKYPLRRILLPLGIYYYIYIIYIKKSIGNFPGKVPGNIPGKVPAECDAKMLKTWYLCRFN